MIESKNISEIMRSAFEKKMVIPAFNAAYVSMVKPIIDTLVECKTFGLVEVARLEVEKFGAQSYETIAKEYRAHCNPTFTRLHLDHIPVIDEDGVRVDWKSLIQRGLDVGYDSVMIDGSRLPFEENTSVTKEVATMAHGKNRPVEAELGAVLGHEKEQTMSYDEIYEKGVGFTNLEQASLFVKRTRVDWLSVAIGNIHGAVSGAAKDKDKVHARLNIAHLHKLSERTNIPLVLHGGSGIQIEYVLSAIKNGITKINIGTDIRKVYEKSMNLEPGNIELARKQVSLKMKELICDVYHIEGSAYKL